MEKADTLENMEEHQEEQDNKTSFPVLYNKEKNRKWKIWVKDAIIYRTDGLSDKPFTKKPSERKIDAKRGTTNKEQALLEARRAWIKKLDGGFAPLKEDEEGMKLYKKTQLRKKEQGGNTHGIGSNKKVLKDTKFEVVPDRVKPPMLAHPYEKRKKSVIWDKEQKAKILTKKTQEQFNKSYFDATQGALVNPKLDGVRCLAVINDDDQVLLLTRNLKQIKHLKHIRKDVRKILNGTDTILDGELYVHTLILDDKPVQGNDKFQFITSACKTTRTDPHPDEKLIEYHVFDIVSDQPQYSRLQLLKEMFSKIKPTYIKRVLTKVCTQENIESTLGMYLEKGYEGLVLRAVNGIYSAKRSIHLLKYKQFEDDEFTIVGTEAAKGTAEGAVIWVCETKTGEQFRCSMQGNFDMRREMLQKSKKYIGKALTVKHQGLGTNGVPRFPIGIRIRDEE